MKICFSVRPMYDDLSIKLFRCLRDEFKLDIEGVFVATTKAEYVNAVRALSGYPKDTCEIVNISEFIERNWDELSLLKLAEYEEKYECTPVWKIIYSDRFLINYSYEDAVKMTAGFFMFFEKLFSKHDISFYYDEVIATIQPYVAYYVGKKHGVEYFSQMIARGLDRTHHYFINDIYQHNALFDEGYKQKTYSEELYNAANKFLQNFEENDIKPGFMSVVGNEPKFRLKYMLYPLLYIKNYFRPEVHNKYSHIYYGLHKNSFEGPKRYFRYRRAKKYYKQPNKNQKFIYYPLHFQPEASTIVCAQKYEKQMFFIDSIVKNLPADTLLYVKEHYAFLGSRHLNFYKEINKNYPNVVLIDPFISSRDLILESEAVATLTGTAGWEAMLLRKPVILGGNIFYENAPGIMKVDDVFRELNEKLKTYCRPSREEVILYLCEYLSTVFEGTCSISNQNYNTDDNIRKVSEAFYKYVQNKISR
jgi:hypothetical protein